MIEPKKNIKNLFRTPPDFIKRVGKIERLDRNERTTPFPGQHLENILNNISPEEVVAYPELEMLYRKLSAWLKIGRDQILLTSGSDTGVRAVYEVYVDEADEVITFPPTYGMYPVYCEMFGGVKKEVLYNEDFSLPLERILDAINERTKLITIANPNHTGTAIAESELARILKVARDKNALVLIDEAYHHFYEGTMLPYIDTFDNLVIVRTFSKAFGIAPLRVGCLISNKDIIAQLYKVKLTHEITSISAKFVEYLLDHQEIMEEHVRDVKEGIKFLSKEFTLLGITTLPTCTNFMFVKLPEEIDGNMMVGLLKEKGFYVNGPFSTLPINGLIRITVGPVGQMRRFISVFKKVYKDIKQSEKETVCNE